MKHPCPVCGWPELHESPRSASGAASFELCPCCGFEFGFDDDDHGLSYDEARARWIAGGMKWWSPSRLAPAGWNASEQLARVRLK
ncbi:MAG: hypothetical protein WDN28_11190 [Chthoniobacter sp.]